MTMTLLSNAATVVTMVAVGYGIGWAADRVGLWDPRDGDDRNGGEADE